MTDTTEISADERKQNNDGTSALHDQQLQDILCKRKKSTNKELRLLQEQRVVGVSLSDNNWTTIAVNLCEKRAAILENEKQEPQDLMELSDFSKHGCRKGVASALKVLQQKELDELESRQLVLKSLQDPQKRFEEAALLLFGRKDSWNLRSQKQKRSGNCLMTEQVQNADIDTEIQSKVKKKTQSLVEVVFSVQSSKRRLHKRLIKQARQEMSTHKGLSSSLDLSSAKRDTDSSDTSNTKNEKKHKRKRKNKFNTLPYTRKKGKTHKNSTIPKKDLHRMFYMDLIEKNSSHETIEELSEVESVSSTTTLRGFPTHRTATQSKTPLFSLSQSANHGEMEIAFNEPKPNVEVNENSIKPLDPAVEEKEKKVESLLSLSQVQSFETHSSIYRNFSTSLQSSSPSSIAQDSITGLQKQDSSSSLSSNPAGRSLSDSSVSTCNTVSSNPASSIKSTDDEIEDVTVFDFWQQKDEDESENVPPSVPPINGLSTLQMQATSSWLDQYTDYPPAQRMSSSSDADELNHQQQPQASDVSFSSDPGITPFAISDAHPLSSEFSDMCCKWKGIHVPLDAWADPQFREFSNTLDHEPTNEDVILYKLFEISEVIEEKFGTKLKQIIGEALPLALEDQLSYKTFRKLSDKLALEAGVRDGTVLVALLGRSLWELFPKLQSKIMEFTSQAIEECFIYSTMLEDGESYGPPDFSEFRSDYDDWKGMLDTEEVQRRVLMENIPFTGSSESLPSLSLEEPGKLPSFPPNPDAYRVYLSLPRPLIARSQSVEVLFIEEAATENIAQDQNDCQNDKLARSDFTPPKRTFSESSLMGSDTRKSSLNSVFDSIKEEGTRDAEGCGGEAYDRSIVRAETKYDVWAHLGKETQTQGIILSTSSIDSFTGLHKTYRHNSLDSTTSTSSGTSSSFEGELAPRNGNQSPTKGRKISGVATPKFDRIDEESEVTTSSDGIDKVKYENITLIKPHPVTTSEGSNDDDISLEEEVGKPTDVGHKSSSAELLVDVAATVGVPIVALSLLALKNVV